MKKDIHPKLNKVDVTDSDGNKWSLLSAIKKNEITVNSSRATHAAWTKQQAVIKDNKKSQKINQFFNFIK